MDRFDRYLGIHAKALTLRSERMGLLASNIANAATPGYKARDLDFAALLGDGGKQALAATNARHFPVATTAGPGVVVGPDGQPAILNERIRYRIPVQPSLDGNTVELATEQVQFAETAVRYRSTLSILNGRIATLTAALKGE